MQSAAYFSTPAGAVTGILDNAATKRWLGINIHHLKDQDGNTSFFSGSKPAVPWGVEFPAYDWEKDLERFRKAIEAAGKRSDILRGNA